MKLFANGKIFTEFQFEKEADFEREVVSNSQKFFGVNSIYIDAKRKIGARSLGNVIPDGFLFDLSDKDNPEFYIVEVELAKHSFYNHIFPQITKFFGFFKNPKSQSELIEKIFTIIENDDVLQEQFKKYLGKREIYKFLKDTIEASQNILLVIDGEKKELPEIMETYTEWGSMISLILIKKFVNGTDTIYSMEPEFENLEFVNIEDDEKEDESVDMGYTEAYHLEGVPDPVKHIYQTIKTQLVAYNPSIIFNPQKHYISLKTDRNLAYFKIRQKKIALVVKKSEEDTRLLIHHNKIKTLSASVQRFWNGPSCAVMIESPEHLEEIISLLKGMITVNQ